MNARTVAVKPCWDVLAPIWEASLGASAAIQIALRINSASRYLRDALRRRRPKTHRVVAKEVRALITFGAPTAAAQVSTSPPDWL